MADNSNSQAEQNIDTSSISPVERRDSLERHLQLRPDPQDLKDRNILHDTTAAPSIQQAQHDLERSQTIDSLKKNLDKRPTKEELIERNVLPDSTAAPSLQEKQRELAKHMRADSLEQKIQQRPKPDELVKEGILQEDENPLKE